jgi:tRNA(Ile)-lysidine synthase
MRKLCGELGSMPDAAGTRRAVAFIDGVRSGAVMRIAPGLRLERSFSRLLLTRVTPAAGVPEQPIAIASAEPGSAEMLLGGRRVRVQWRMETGPVPGGSASFDPAGLTFPLVLRGWRPGDQIRLSCGSKKLKKLFVERRVARTLRHQVPVLAESGDGAVLWLAGIARAAVAVPSGGAPTFCVRIEE